MFKKYYNIGFAADTPNGLVVPVIKNADQKSVSQIAQEMAVMSKTRARRQARARATCRAVPSSFSSSLGGIGGTYFTPLINAPEVAILGLSKLQTKPLWDGEKFVPRQVLPLSLSYDHRVIDAGAAAARFNAYFGVDLQISARCCVTCAGQWGRQRGFCRLTSYSSPSTKMTTITVVRKNGEVAIASDGLSHLWRHSSECATTKANTTRSSPSVIRWIVTSAAARRTTLVFLMCVSLNSVPTCSWVVAHGSP